MQTIDEIIKKDLDEYFENNINSTYYFTKINYKYVYTGSLHFSFIPGKKRIECIIDKEDLGPGLVFIKREHDDNSLEDEPIKIHELELQGESASKILNCSVIKEESEDQEGVELEHIIHVKTNKHFRVKSNFSLGTKSNNFTAKEIEIELKKTFN